MNIETRSQQDVATVGKQFVAHCGTHAHHQVGVPCGSQQRSHWEAGRIVGFAVASHQRVHAHTRGAIHHDGVGYSQAGYGVGGAGSVGDDIHAFSRLDSHQQMGFLFKGHRFDNLVDGRFAQLGQRFLGGHRQATRRHGK